MPQLDPTALPEGTRATNPVMRALADLPEGTWETPDRGRLAWKTLFAGEVAPTEALARGVAIFPAGGFLAPHRHAQPEVHFGLEGEVTVTLEGAVHALGPGAALFIPGGALHAVAAGSELARFLDGLAADRCADVIYDFPSEAGHAP